MDVRVVVRLGALSAGALATATAPLEPTGLTAVDVVYRAAVGLVVAAAFGRSRRAPLVVSAVAVTVVALTGSPWWALGAAAAALAMAVRPVERTMEGLWLATIAGAVAAGAAVRASLDAPYGVTGLAVAVALAPVLISGYRQSRRRTRTWIRRGALAAMGLGIVLTGASVAAALSQRNTLNLAVEAAEAGLDAVAAGEEREGVDHLRRAAQHFDRAHGVLGSPLLLPARLVPVVGWHVGLATGVLDDGRALVTEAQVIADDAALERFRLRRGQLDLAAVREVRDQLATTAAVAERAQARVEAARDHWLVPPVRSRLDTYGDALAEVVPSVQLAAEAADAIPSLLGGSGAVRYVVAFMTPAEARGLGGFLGHWAEVTAADGRIRLEAVGHVSELRPPRGGAWEIDGHDDYLARWGRFRPGVFVQDIPFSPDFPTVAGVLSQVYEQARGRPVDGVIGIDPLALQSLVRLLGPVEVPDTDLTLTGRSTADFLLKGQYARFSDDDQRTAVLAELVEQVFHRLVTGELPPVRAVVDLLGPRVEQGRLMMTVRDTVADRFLGRVGLRNPFPPVIADFLAVTHQNMGLNKIDPYLRRHVAYDVELDPGSGAASATVTITLHNTAPASGLPDAVLEVARDDIDDPELTGHGTNLARLSVYSRLRPRRATLDGEPLTLDVSRELGRPVGEVVVPVPAGATRVVQVQLTGRLPAGDGYGLVVAPQPLVEPPTYEVTVRADGGRARWELAPDGAERDGPSVRWQAHSDAAVAARLEPAG